MSERAPLPTHFGFTRTPFGKSLSPAELLTRQPHQEAVARILHCIAESAPGVITGEVGTGTTVAARAARAMLDPSRYAVIYIANPAFGTRGLYVTAVRALGATPRFFKAEVMAQTSELLEAEEAERHRRVVIVVDEAHLLSPAQLEELRLLTNAEMDSRSPFAGILLGQPSLSRQLRLGGLRRPRPADRDPLLHIRPMDLGDAAAYLPTTSRSPNGRTSSSPTTRSCVSIGLPTASPAPSTTPRWQP